MSIKNKAFSRAGNLVAAILVTLGALVPALTPLVSASTAQVQTRSIEMSDATPSKTGVSYKVSFTPATSGADSLVIDFCSNSSIIGGACTAPLGMDAKTSVGFTAGTHTTGWNVDTGASFASASTVAVKDGTPGSNNLGTSASDFTLTGVVNPSGTGTFWARVYTYSDATYGSSGTVYTDQTHLGSYIDYGGFALSTTALINITATVMETLTFCTSGFNGGTPPTSGCGGTVPASITLGHGSPLVLDSSQADTGNAYFQVSTNALTGAVIRMKTQNTCSGLSRDGGSTCPIPGQGATPDFFTTAGIAEFGLNVGAGSGGTGTVNADAPYSTASKYAMDTTTNNDVTAAYGTAIADTNNAATASVNSLLTFAAQASVTTPAGVYSANESLIATGTF
jgi:hypothetical protein